MGFVEKYGLVMLKKVNEKLVSKQMAFYSSNELYVPKTNVGSSISNDWSKKPLEDFDSLKDQNFNEKSNAAAAARSCIRLTHKLYLLEIANNVIQHTFGQKKTKAIIFYKSHFWKPT